MLRRTIGLLGVFVVLAFPAHSRAQGVIPGGWSPQFGFQVVAGPGAVAFGTTSPFGFGGPGFAAGPFGFGGPVLAPGPFGFGAQTAPFFPGQMTPGVFGANTGAFLMSSGPPVNALDPLAHSIRQATRKRRGR